jgi:carbon monoxide dehydrogenase subunit G
LQKNQQLTSVGCFFVQRSGGAKIHYFFKLYDSYLHHCPPYLIISQHDGSFNNTTQGCAMRFLPLSLAATTLIGLLPVLGHASITVWNDPTPSALAPFAGQANSVADLAGSDIMIYGHAPRAMTLPSSRGPRYYPKAGFTSAALVVSATPQQVKQTLSNYAGYVGLFPTLTSAKTIEQQGNISQVKYHIHVPVPIPLLSFSEDVVMQHQLTDNSLSTLLIDSPIQYGQGKFEWFALPNGKTLVTLTQWGDLNEPKGFVISTMFKAMPEIKSAIPSSVNAFVLESLRRRFMPETRLPAAQSVANIVPVLDYSDAQMNTIQRLIDQSKTPVVFTHVPRQMQTSKRNENMHFVTSITTLNAPIAKTQSALADPRSYTKMLRQVRRVESTTLPNDQGQDSEIHVGMGLGVISIPFKLHMRFRNESDHTVRYWANGGDIEFMQGRMRFEAINAKQTRVIMTSAGKVGDDAPFLLKIGRSLPYSDFLPTVGTGPILFEKASRFLQGKS